MTLPETDASEPNEVDSSEDDRESDERSTPEREPRFTQADIDRIVAERIARDRRSRAAKQRRQREKTSTTDNAESAESTRDDGSWRDDFYDAIDGYKLTRGQRKRMREAFRRELPDDPDAWVQEWCTDFGIPLTDQPDNPEPKRADSEREPETPEEPKPKAPKPVSDRGSPQPLPDWDQLTDPRQLSDDDLNRMLLKHGEKVRNRKVREMAENFFKGVKVVRG